MRMKKKPLNLLVDEELVTKARDHGLNLSRFFENQLRGYFDFMEQRSMNYTPYIKQERREREKDRNTDSQEKSINRSSDNPNVRVCRVAWISQRPPEPLTRVQIPADPSKTYLYTKAYYIK